MNRSRREYQRRVNRVVDYIEKHPAEQLSLARLAQIAAFSPYHFHRIFKSITHETLFDFSQRLRLEKAAQALLASSHTSVTQMAEQYGFASGATFARAFKAHFSMNASEWRAGGYRRWREWRKNSKSGKAPSKTGKAGAWRKADTASGRYAVCKFNGTVAEIADICDRTFSAWLPDSGFEPDDKPFIELYRDASGPDPGKGPIEVELCLPVRPL